MNSIGNYNLQYRIQQEQASMSTEQFFLYEQQNIVKQLSSAIAQKKFPKRNLRSQPQQVFNHQTHPPPKKKHSNPSSHHSNHKPTHNQGQQKGKQEDDIESLDISDMLKTLCHQKKVLTGRRREEFYQIHLNWHLAQDDYKYFMMIASQANYRKLDYPGYYANLLSEAGKYPELFFSCINKDIPRTMPDDHPLQANLKNVLYAYAIRNPSLLYCQGMNYLVGFLLINKFAEEEAFWFVVQLIEDIVMPDYFKDLSTISLTVQIFENVMEEVFPELAREMREVGMESGIFLVGWYICLFTKGFINSVSQHLLQEIVLQSFHYPIGFTLIRISLGIFATLFTREQPFTFQQRDFKSLKQCIQNSVYELSLEQLKTGMNYFQFNFQAYQRLMTLYSRKRQKIFAKALEKELHEKKLSLPPCSVDLPVCIHRVEIEKKIGTVEQVLILKNNIPIIEQYIQSYFPERVNKSQPKISYEGAKECPITHHSHICQLANHNKMMPHRRLKQQTSEYYPIHEGECSIEIQSRFSRVEDRFSELSEYFIVDDKEDLGDQREGADKIGLERGREKEVEDQANNKSQVNFVASVGNVFRKALDGIRLLRSGLAEGTNTYFNSAISQNSP